MAIDEFLKQNKNANNRQLLLSSKTSLKELIKFWDNRELQTTKVNRYSEFVTDLMAGDNPLYKARMTIEKYNRGE